LPLSNTSAATSELAGAILADSGRTVSLTSGTLSHASQSFTAVGITGNRSLATAGNFATPTTNYNYLRIVALEGSSDIVVGAVTLASDVPVSGTAHYTGRFDGVALIDGTVAPQQMTNWSSDVTAEFTGAGGTMTATFSGGGVDEVDRIEISNVVISGSSFTGGDLAATRNAGGMRQAVTIFGNDADIAGNFFGSDVQAVVPAEIGGVVRAAGNSSEFFGLFIAD
jgi:hypothetical protein